MNPMQDLKRVTMIGPVSVTTDGSTGAIVDTKGYDYATIDIGLGLVSNTLVACALQEADTTDSTNFANVTGFVGGSSAAGGFTFPTGDSEASVAIRMNVPLPERKRYLRLNFDPGAAQIVSAVAHLSRADVTPVTAAQRGVAVDVVG